MKLIYNVSPIVAAAATVGLAFYAVIVGSAELSIVSILMYQGLLCLAALK